MPRRLVDGIWPAVCNAPDRLLRHLRIALPTRLIGEYVPEKRDVQLILLARGVRQRMRVFRLRVELRLRADDAAANMTDPSDRPVEHRPGPGRVGPAAARSHDADLVSLKQGYVQFFPALNEVPLHRRRRAANFLEAVAFKDGQELRSIGCPDEEVEVFVRSRYATEEEVKGPAAAEPASRAGRLDHRNELLD